MSQTFGLVWHPEPTTVSNAPPAHSPPSLEIHTRRGAVDISRSVFRRRLCRLLATMRRNAATASLTLIAVFLLAPPGAAAQSLAARASEIEIYLYGHPKPAPTELAALAQEAESAQRTERRFVDGLDGQAMVASGRKADAIALAQRIEREAAVRADDLALATARLVRGTVETSSGDYGHAKALAKEARALANGAADPNLDYWSAMMIGITARGRGQMDEALLALQSALSAAESMNNAYRRSYALYQLSQLYLAMKQPQRALESSRQSFGFAEAAGAANGMAKARMAESAAMELLADPARELAAMEEALAIARKSQSRVAESLALINLADIELRRRNFNAALEHSRRSLSSPASTTMSG